MFNANYVLYFDVAFTELWRDRIGPWQEMPARGIEVVVGEVNVRWRGSARFDDELELHCRVVDLGTTSLTTEIDVVRDGEVLVEGRLRHVCVDARTFDKTPWPDWIREGLSTCVA